MNDRVKSLLTGLGALGFCCWAVLLLIDRHLGAAALLVVGVFLVWCAMGAAFLTSADVITGAKWTHSLRQLFQPHTAVLPLGLALVLVAIVFFPDVYPWYAGAGESGHSLSRFKAWWLSRWFFLARAIVYAGLAWLLTNRLVAAARSRPGNAGAPYSLRCWSACYLIGLALICWLASYDWIMSLEPEWYSTVFGVYFFAGMFVTGLAVVTIATVIHDRFGAVGFSVSRDQYHDLGKLLFGATTFWAYIWYCQYMLIWYVNVPEEAIYYVHRMKGIWESWFWLNLGVTWGVPFLILLPRATKRSPRVLCQIACLLLFGRILDLYLMIYPRFDQIGLAGLPSCASLVVAVGAAYVLIYTSSFRSRALPQIGTPGTAPFRLPAR